MIYYTNLLTNFAFKDKMLLYRRQNIFEISFKKVLLNSSYNNKQSENLSYTKVDELVANPQLIKINKL